MMIFVLILGLLFTLFGVGLCLHGLYLIIMAIRSRTWPEVPATITAGELITTHLSGTASRTSHCRAQITYSYTVKGETFTSSRFAFESKGLLNTFQEAKARLQRYPLAAEATAHYHPGNPAQSVLQTGIQRYTYEHAYLGLILLFLAGIVETILWLSLLLR